MANYLHSRLSRLASSPLWHDFLCWYCAGREFLCELRNSFWRIAETLKLDLVDQGLYLGSPRGTRVGQRLLSKTEWQRRIEDIEHMQSVRPWASLFDWMIFLEGGIEHPSFMAALMDQSRNAHLASLPELSFPTRTRREPFPLPPALSFGSVAIHPCPSVRCT